MIYTSLTFSFVKAFLFRKIKICNQLLYTHSATFNYYALNSFIRFYNFFNRLCPESHPYSSSNILISIPSTFCRTKEPLLIPEIKRPGQIKFVPGSSIDYKIFAFFPILVKNNFHLGMGSGSSALHPNHKCIVQRSSPHKAIGQSVGTIFPVMDAISPADISLSINKGLGI